MQRSILRAALAAAAACAVAAVDPEPARQGVRTLALLDSDALKTTHSKFFAQLQARGHQVTFAKAGQPGVAAQRYGSWEYDNIVVFAPAAADFGGLSVDDLVAFLDGGGNLLVAASSDVGTAVRELAAECGVDFDAARARVTDHFQYDESDPSGAHTRVITTAYFPSAAVVGQLAATRAPLLFDGIGAAINPDNILALKAVTASDTGYSAFPGEAIKEYPQSAGRETVLVAAVQARNNARAVFAGSLWMFSDEAFTSAVRPGGGTAAASGLAASTSGNAAFADAVSRWAFQEAGVLRASNVRHRRADGRPPERMVTDTEKPDLPRSMFPDPEIAREALVYRIKDDVEYLVDLHVYNGSSWQPYVASDVQLEFVMLDPYVRQTMAHVRGGTYKAAFRAPDVYGIYQFRLMYRRAGLSVVHVTDQVSVRPFRHNEYERFILSAYPYYASAISMMAGVFIFALLFLYSK